MPHISRKLYQIHQIFHYQSPFIFLKGKEEDKSDSSNIPLHVLDKLETLERLITVAASHTTNKDRYKNYLTI